MYFVFNFNFYLFIYLFFVLLIKIKTFQASNCSHNAFPPLLVAVDILIPILPFANVNPSSILRFWIKIPLVALFGKTVFAFYLTHFAL